MSRLFQIAALCLSLVAYALPGNAADPFPAEALMYETGMDHMLGSMHDWIVAAPDAAGHGEDAMADLWRQETERIYVVAPMNQDLLQLLGAAPLSQADQDVLAGFFRSELGLRVTALDIALSEMSSAEQSAMDLQSGAIVAGLKPDRKALLDRLIEVNLPLTSAFSRAYFRAELAASLLAGGPEKLDWAVAVQLGDAKYVWGEAAEKQFNAQTWAYEYRDLTDAELEQVVVFLETPAARNFYAVAGKALKSVLDATIEDIGNAVAAKL